MAKKKGGGGKRGKARKHHNNNVSPLWSVPPSWCTTHLPDFAVQAYRLLTPCSKLMNNSHPVKDCSTSCTCCGFALAGSAVPNSESGKEVESFVEKFVHRPPGLDPIAHSDTCGLDTQKTTSCGLVNLGNTCYANAVLQMMFSNTELRQAVMQEYETNANNETLREVSLLFGRMAMLKGVPQSPAKLLSSLDVPVAEQQDVHEFVRLFMGYLEGASALLRTTMVQLYQGVVLNNRRCDTCGLQSQRSEPVMDLLVQVNVPGKSLEESLRRLQEPEKLTGNNLLDCSGCKSRQEGTTCTTIKRFPPVVVIPLVRFLFDEKKHERKKICDKFSFPLKISFQEGTQHHLTAVLLHRGPTPFMGHYVAHVREGESVWTEYNDDAVKDVSAEYNRSREGKIESTEAYVLVYTLQDKLSLPSPAAPVALADHLSLECSTHIDEWQRFHTSRKRLLEKVREHNEIRDNVLRKDCAMRRVTPKRCYAVDRKYVKAWAHGRFFLSDEAAVSGSDNDDTVVVTKKDPITPIMMCPHNKLALPAEHCSSIPYKIVSRAMMVAMKLLPPEPERVIMDVDDDGEDDDDDSGDDDEPEPKFDNNYPLRTLGMFCSACTSQFQSEKEAREREQEKFKNMKALAMDHPQVIDENAFWVSGIYFDAWKKQTSDAPKDATKDLLCEHGGLISNVGIKGRKVPQAVWEYMNPTGLPLPCSHVSICSICLSANQAAKSVLDAQVRIRQQEGSALSNLTPTFLYDLNKRVNASSNNEYKKHKEKYKNHDGTKPNYENVYYAIDSDWIQLWRMWFEDKSGNVPPPPDCIDHSRFVCPHQGTVLALDDIKNTSSTRSQRPPKLALVTPSEYDYLRSKYRPTVDILYNEVNDQRFLHPVTCTVCRLEALKVFASGEVTVRGTCKSNNKRGKVEVDNVFHGVSSTTTIGELKRKYLVPYLLTSLNAYVDVECIRLGNSESPYDDAQSFIQLGILNGSVIHLTYDGEAQEAHSGSSAVRENDVGFTRTRLVEGQLPPLVEEVDLTKIWACSACTFHNPLRNKSCEVCGTPK
eukprot:PhF_6_TR31515/c0_g1_i1/m.46437/K11858/USP48; ubiquitin carboxyl-terminal hydrolase 48